jgi:hypothetical protein
MLRTLDRPAVRIVDRAACLAYTFLVMNYSAVAGLIAAVTRKNVWPR